MKLIRRMVLFCVLMCSVLSGSEATYAKEFDLPKEVTVVKNEKQMISKLLSGMKKHKTSFSFYYPGISRKFKKYRKQSLNYSAFFDKLSVKDGYTMGTVSGYCVMICGTDKKYVTFQFGYLTTKKQEVKITKKVKKIIKQIGKGSKKTKVRKAHDYLIKHMRYDGRYYNPYYAFTKGRGNCMCYSLAFQRMMQEMKIPCRYVKGKNHVWNKVKLGNRWYKVDVTLDDR